MRLTFTRRHGDGWLPMIAPACGMIRMRERLRMGRSPGEAPVPGGNGFRRVGGGRISLEWRTHAAR